MSQETIQHRAAVVRKTWTYGERLQRVVAAQKRCQQLLAQLGLTNVREMAYAGQAARGYRPRRSG